MWLALLLVASLAALFLIMLGAIWGINKAADILIGQKHRLLEEIVNTGQVPEQWARSDREKIARLSRVSANQDRLLRAQSRTKAAYLKKLDQLVRYAEQTPLVEDEPTRRMLLVRLAAVRSAWAKREPSEFQETP